METVITATIIGASILLAFAALGTAIGFAILGGKFLESSARFSFSQTHSSVYYNNHLICLST